MPARDPPAHHPSEEVHGDAPTFPGDPICATLKIQERRSEEATEAEFEICVWAVCGKGVTVWPAMLLRAIHFSKTSFEMSAIYLLYYTNFVF